MKVVFFSSSTNAYDAASFHYTAYPANAERLEELAALHPEHEFAVVARLPAFFLVDLEHDGSFMRKARGVEYVLLSCDGSFAAGCADKAAAASLSGAGCADKATSAYKACAAAVAALAPDLAIAATCWMTPFDWLPLEDALIAEELRAAGIRTLCHSPASAELCFDKRMTREFLKAHQFPSPESIFLDHSLFWAGRGGSEIAENPYKELLFARLEKLHYPAVIKDTTGLSSFGMDVVNSAKAARSILESRKTNGDRLIEEFAEGDQFGVEVYGTPGHYQVMTPFLFSVTRHGITSPKQSVKLSVSGDEAESRFRLVDMRRLVTDMAEALNLQGAAQFDLVFSDKDCAYGGWTVIEVNPRLSGLTVPTSVLAEKSAYELLLAAALGEPAGAERQTVVTEHSLDARASGLSNAGSHGKGNSCCEDRSAPACVLDVKLTVLVGARLEELCALPYVYAVNQTANDGARQIRERGYCEVVLGAESVTALLESLADLKAHFPEELDDGFVEAARALALRAY